MMQELKISIYQSFCWCGCEYEYLTCQTCDLSAQTVSPLRVSWDRLQLHMILKLLLVDKELSHI